MRYLAQRVGTGEWLHRDLPLADVERTRELSGPGQITATIDPELRQVWHTDGLRLLEDWGTIVYVADDSGQIRSAGIVVPPTQFEDAKTQLTCPGFASYANGYYFTESAIWGPQHATPATEKAIAKPELPRPDPLQIVQDHWAWIQAQQDSDLGIRFVGDLASNQRVGDYETPYRLRWFESVDLGSEIDTLVGDTPFDYVEEHEWANDDQTVVDHRIRLGWPRLGRMRDDLRFALGENITATVPVSTVVEYANQIIGIGNGEGSSMNHATASKRDGRLRRTKILTDKTASQARIERRTQAHLARLSHTVDIGEVSIIDHPNARISAVSLGDDIYVQTEVPSYGSVSMWVRVLGISQGEDSHAATLSTQRSSAFIYNSTEGIA